MSSEGPNTLDAALSAKLSKAMQGRDTTPYSAEVRDRAQLLMRNDRTAVYDFWEDAPESVRNYYLKQAQG